MLFAFEVNTETDACRIVLQYFCILVQHTIHWIIWLNIDQGLTGDVLVAWTRSNDCFIASAKPIICPNGAASWLLNRSLGLLLQCHAHSPLFEPRTWTFECFGVSWLFSSFSETDFGGISDYCTIATQDLGMTGWRWQFAYMLHNKRSACGSGIFQSSSDEKSKSVERWWLQRSRLLTWLFHAI